MTDCIISGFTCSPSIGRAAARSVSLCDFSWPSASMIWNSSSMPIVRRGTSMAATLVRALEALIRADPLQIPARRPLDSILTARHRDAIPPAAIDAIERERSHGRDDTTDRVRRQRDVVRVAPHEAHEANVLDDRNGVADEERALALGARRPVQDRAPFEVVTARRAAARAAPASSSRAPIPG